MDEGKEKYVTNVTGLGEFREHAADEQSFKLWKVARERSNEFDALMGAAKCSWLAR